MNKGKFESTSFVFEPEVEPADSLKIFVEDGQIYNHEELLFKEELYIDGQDEFVLIVDKLKKKKFNNKLRIFDEKTNTVVNVSDFSDEVKIISSVLSENNINGLNKNDIQVSIKHFAVYDHSERITKTKNIYLLLFLSNFTEYKNNHFKFSYTSDQLNFNKEFDFIDTPKFDLGYIYDWIVSSAENVPTRLKIIREIILRKQTLELNSADLESAKSAFNRIVKEQTDKYFAQVNSLKDDFLNLSQKKTQSYNALHVKLLGWFSAIALFIYDELKDFNFHKNNVWEKLVFTVNERTQLFTGIFLIALIVIAILFVKEMYDSQQEYKKIKEFYTQQLFFESNDFDNYLPEPKIEKSYLICFIILLIVLVFRLFA